ncbi:uncharacterized protein LOC128671300 [Plodia interpunctella]|uniref:uncharacterized protein LOC128671300 n=1 Tax=Plodia interpunctella TaxID=58824 RepID=UPI0023688EEF|nr:uncharacterized protein LOC128671300 [Plodia interpunctella]
MFSLVFLFLTLFINKSLSSEYAQSAKLVAAKEIAEVVKNAFISMFMRCVSTPMNNQFSIDNLQSFVNYESKTTVGFAPKFTGNRRFFANMIGTPQFKNMLEEDEEQLRKSMVQKMKYCDEVVMDEELLKDFYDKEVE